MILPSSLFILEKDIIDIKKEDVKVKSQKALHATYIRLNLEEASETKVSLNEFRDTFEHYLKENMRLNNDLVPLDHSVAEGPVRINYINEYDTSRKYLKVELGIPIKPQFYKKMLLGDKEYFTIVVSFKTSFPVDK